MNSSSHIHMEMMLKQMDLWYRTPLGAALLAAERAALAPLLQDNFGHHLLQIGGPNEAFLFEPHSFFHAVRLSPERSPVFKGPSVRGFPAELPFLPESMDVILLPHALEVAPDPVALLSQSHLVLAPEGRVILMGFNPWSVWGLCKWGIGYPAFLRQHHFLSPFRVKQWLKQAGFVIEQVGSLFFRPPIQSQKNLQRCMALEALGRLLWANNGGVYLIVARKQVISLTPIGESLRYASST